jgi:hypothetical protein
MIDIRMALAEGARNRCLKGHSDGPTVSNSGGKHGNRPIETCLLDLLRHFGIEQARIAACALPPQA